MANFTWPTCEENMITFFVPIIFFFACQLFQVDPNFLFLLCVKISMSSKNVWKKGEISKIVRHPFLINGESFRLNRVSLSWILNRWTHKGVRQFKIFSPLFPGFFDNFEILTNNAVIYLWNQGHKMVSKIDQFTCWPPKLARPRHSPTARLINTQT